MKTERICDGGKGRMCTRHPPYSESLRLMCDPSNFFLLFSFTIQKTLSGEMEGGKYLPEGFIREPAPDGKLQSLVL